MGRYPALAAVIATEANRPPAGSIPPDRTSACPNPPRRRHHLPPFSERSANLPVVATLLVLGVIWSRSANPSHRPVVRGPATVRAARGRHSRP
jgi:hypothetical protein